ncbi:hypothetical protein HMPREF1083_05679 [[Clostridium] clostridioforme 90A6]|uniref:Phage tail tape measure protein, TP901 family, core region n=1 Tax=[Clostridium] clostridioforme 90A6 TaxID=999406 RepID=R0AZR4_9FIRM|nr:hypothetical protein [Enterocloster clostridioformis]ENZ57651.1 hypothetical protein HMPREF1083_05679 [[Clostridium] clostridioforme 90A6]
MASDGSLKFDTKIDVEGFEEGISTLSKAMDMLTSAVNRLSSNILSRFNGAGQAMAETAQSAEMTSDAVESVGSAADESAKHVKSLQEQMDAISVHAMQDTASDTAQSAPVSAPTSAESLNYDPKAMAAVFGDAASEIHSWSDAVEQYGNQAGMAMNELQQDAAEAEQAVSEASSQGAEQARGYVGLKESILNAFKNVPRVFGQIPVAAKRELSKIPGIVKGAFSSATRTVLNFGKSLGKGLADKAKQAVSSLKGLGKSSNSVSKSILKLSNMFKLMLIRMAMRAAIQGVKEGMQNLVQYSDSANQSMSNLMSGMTYLKNSFAAAFAPILSIVAPVLNTLINLLATAVGYINQFFSALGGGSTFVRAKKANEDYAASLKKTGGAASKAGKDAKKALAPFDDLVQIQQQGADASGGGGGGASPSDMFETVGIDKGISDFANKLKEMFAAGDWEGIGQLIGQKINEAVQSFTQFISWDNIGAQITAFVTAFTTLFNSLVSTIDWYAIGIMFGTGINTLANTLYLLLTQIDWFMLGNALGIGLMGMIDTVDWNLFGATIGAFFQAKISGLLGFVLGVDWGAIGAAIATCLMGLTDQIDWAQLGYLFAAGLNAAFSTLGEFAATFDWVGFGTQLATSLSTFFQTFDWAGAGTAISDIVIGILNALVTFITETDWWAFGDGVATALEHIDWTTVANRLFAVIGAALGGIGAIIGGLISDGVVAAKEYFQGKIEECGGNVVDGIFKGIIDAMKAVGTWVQNNVFKPFMDAFKSAFGIHSPSTVMAGMGQYLWEGFCNGIKEFFSDPVGFIRTNITDPFVNGVKNLLGIHSPSTVLAGIGSNTVSGFNQGVTNEQAASQSVVQSWASGVASWFSDKFGISSGDSAESKKWATSIMRGFNNTVNKNYTQSQSVMETWAENVRKWFVGVDEVQGVNELSWTKFAELIIQAFKVKIDDSHTETRLPMETWAKNVKEWFWGDSDLEGTGGMYAAFYDMAKRINEGFANGISDFAYMAKAAIKKWAREAMEEAEEEFDINSPSKEFYGIAEYVVRGFNDGISAMAASSRNTVQKWLDGVLDVFDGVEVKLPIGINIPNAASYLPRMASGTVVPPRAGEMSTSMRNTAGYGQEETLGYLVAKMDEMISRLQAEGNRPIQIVLNLTGNLAALARVLKPELDKEAARKGVSLVIVGGS